MASPAYIDLAFMLTKYNNEMLTDLTNTILGLSESTPNETIINGFIVEAEGEINSVLSLRYDIPLVNTDTTTPVLIKSLARVMTFHLLGIGVYVDEALKEAERKYNLALKKLDRLAEGDLQLYDVDINFEFGIKSLSEQTTTDERFDDVIDNFIPNVLE